MGSQTSFRNKVDSDNRTLILESHGVLGVEATAYKAAMPARVDTFGLFLKMSPYYENFLVTW